MCEEEDIALHADIARGQRSEVDAAKAAVEVAVEAAIDVAVALARCNSEVVKELHQLAVANMVSCMHTVLPILSLVPLLSVTAYNPSTKFLLLHLKVNEEVFHPNLLFVR
mmetsp:Transcript_27785/g.41011  ORF Transcript_27785/g.41011 Transcript_27785/m.41011 type:complete len:110 (-) Transcript_27785:3207-3536(-)